MNPKSKNMYQTIASVSKNETHVVINLNAGMFSPARPSMMLLEPFKTWLDKTGRMCLLSFYISDNGSCEHEAMACTFNEYWAYGDVAQDIKDYMDMFMMEAYYEDSFAGIQNVCNSFAHKYKRGA